MRPSPKSTIPHLLASLQFKRQAQLQLNTWRTQCIDDQDQFGHRGFQLRQTHCRGLTTKTLPERPRPRRRPIAKYTDAELSNEDEIVGPTAGRHKRSIGPMVWASCTFGFVVSSWAAYIYSTYSRALKVADKLDLPQNANVSDRWKDRTRNFDDEVNSSEMLMLLKWKRRRLVQQAFGSVLEVSCGTGRNIELYDLRSYDPEETQETGRSRKRIITSITFNDQSEVMIEHAERKFKKMEANWPPINRFNGPVNFIVGDAGLKGLVKRPEGGYDTIVQTMGVCSMVDAAGFLRRLGELCRQPGEESKWLPPEADDGKGGKILLLEHGKGYFSFMNRILDNGAKMHADHYGCWWNKDVDEVVRQSGLVVERARRSNFGTTYEYTLRPPKKGV